MTYKVLYVGTPEVAVAPLEGLHEAGFEIVGVLTREDAPVGRKRVLTPSPVAARAEELGLPVIKANKWSGEVAEDVKQLGADIAAVVAYGAILPQSALDLLPQGWINLHFSSLPAWRGAAPVQRALMAGETEIFSNTFRIEAGLDTGPVFVEESTRVEGTDTAGDILARLAATGGALLARTFEAIEAGATGTEQTGEPTHAAKLTIADGKLDFTRPTAELLAQTRGVTPEPGAWCTYKDARFKLGMVVPSDADISGTAPGTVQIINKKCVVTCGDGALELTQVQPAGKKMMNATDWARGTGSALNEQKMVLV
ncbi:methionyl-tRNA formyltransferase [Rothia sp. ZJ932]|uniref:methionyl-tRNA formyltransferase n=1 Tax=Rothia sp. ZJ932 TaxID=2810516 RepID=UPI0019671711|nr:methionyl-tRNA formyltransferase [Rothia sp. ZJ932]QRZ60867.1 methionyl-tRNA formyltransferase [Rothia sp. ZJ932]